MRDIKVKPAMDTPKAKQKAPAPRDAGAILQQHMDKRQTKREPENRSPTHYAVNQMGKGARRGTASAVSVSRRMMKHRPKAAVRAVGAAKQAGRAVGRAVLSAVSPILAMGGGAVILVLLAAVVLAAAVAASPFGILFVNESSGPDTVPLSSVVEQINSDLEAKLEALREENSCDSAVVEGAPADWAEVLAVFAVKAADAGDVTAMDADRAALLAAVFWDMMVITSQVEAVGSSGGDQEEKTLYIIIAAKTADEMKAAYRFDRQQAAMLEELLAQRELLLELIEGVQPVDGDTTAF